MADDSLNILNCETSDIVEPRPPDDILAAFYSVAQSLLPGLNIPYDLGSPLRNSAITSSPNYDLKLPAGVQIPKLDDRSATDMLSSLQPLMNAVTMGLAILGPVKVIIDIIIAIINVLCAIPNPLKIAEALSALFIALIPLLGLFPATAALQVLIETAKSIIMILTSILMQILPKIDLVIENVENAIASIAGNNNAGAEGAIQKICVVLQTMLDDLAILAPINKVLDLINSFMGLAVGGICTPGGGCCDECPAIVRNPPSGGCTIEVADETANTTEIRLQTAFWTENYLGAPPVGAAVIGEAIPISRLIDPLLLLFGQTPAGTNEDPLGSKLIDLATFAPSMFEVTFDIRGLRSRPINASATGTQVTIEMSYRHGYVAGERFEILGTAFNGILNGRHSVLSSTETTITYELEVPAFERTQMHGATLRKIYNISSARIDIDDDNILNQDVIIKVDGIIESPSEYFMFANEEAVLSADLMTQGCVSSVSNSRSQFETERDTDFPTAIRTNNGGVLPPGAGFNSPPNVLLGIEIPRIDEEGIKQIVVDFAANPASAGRNAVFDKINIEIDKFRDLARRALCVLVSSTYSVFTADREIVDFSDGVITISYQPRSRDNQPILVGLPNNVDVNSVFTTTFGTLGPVAFDSSTGTYTATLIAESAGTASVRAFFVTSDVCSTPRDGTSSSSSPLNLDVRFLDGTAKPQRKDRKYIQSSGGRRR